ncbi:hypothetical protein BpHYR1_030176 [Brachionus plicatilis]|uniref:Uncharacterized protein n=1 Tax=Brachionus plicatilis TaxID=10195 RepID=A0A3M7RGA0_BRAPC|nr:hypothetical protein BpHYR1_030176 [Brachionus plicatilis]
MLLLLLLLADKLPTTVNRVIYFCNQASSFLTIWMEIKMPTHLDGFQNKKRIQFLICLIKNDFCNLATSFLTIWMEIACEHLSAERSGPCLAKRTLTSEALDDTRRAYLNLSKYTKSHQVTRSLPEIVNGVA